jgi:hypothetical protein
MVLERDGYGVYPAVSDEGEQEVEEVAGQQGDVGVLEQELTPPVPVL